MSMSAIRPAGADSRALSPIDAREELGIYAYVGNDPVNFTDPLGLKRTNCVPTNGTILVCADRPKPQPKTQLFAGIVGSALRSDASASHGSFEGGGGEAQEGGGVVVDPFLKQACRAAAAPINPSSRTTSRAVNGALSEVFGGKSGPLSRPYSREFAQPNALPNITAPGWVRSSSGHAGYAWEAAIPSMPGHVVKVYMNDRDAGGRITATITTPMGVGHLADYAVNRTTGYVGNAQRAQEYLKGQQCP